MDDPKINAHHQIDEQSDIVKEKMMTLTMTAVNLFQTKIPEQTIHLLVTEGIETAIQGRRNAVNDTLIALLIIRQMILLFQFRLWNENIVAVRAAIRNTQRNEERNIILDEIVGITFQRFRSPDY